MRTKTLGAWTAVVMTVIGLTVTGSALFTISQVGGIEKTWRSFENDASTKGTILNALRNDRGFTALVHSFTEYASSGKISDIEKIQKGITDTLGNLVYHGTGRNWNPIMATAATITVVEVDQVHEPGGLDPEMVITQAIFIDRMVLAA